MALEEHDWLFDVLAELSLHSEQIGYSVLSEALTLCMDAFELDERRLRSGIIVERLQRSYGSKPIRLRSRKRRYQLSSSAKIQQGPTSMGLIEEVRVFSSNSAA